jgi:hypothetical protein
MNIEQFKQLLKQSPAALGWLLAGVVLTLAIGQYQGSIEIQFGEGYFKFGEGYIKVDVQPPCEVSNQ